MHFSCRLGANLPIHRPVQVPWCGSGRLAAAFTSHGSFPKLNSSLGFISVVMPGLAPGIHLLAKMMDRRVRPGDDSEANF
jgi:hypothetical protein